jgi:hypothetical protein
MDPTQAMQIAITGITVIPDTHKYTIEVRMGAGPSPLRWEVQKRFSEFDQMHGDLKYNHNLSLLPRLPPKSVLSTALSDHALEKRRAALEKMLHRMLARPDIRTSGTFRRFLGFDSHTDMNPAKLVEAGPVSVGTLEDCKFGVSGVAVSPLPDGGALVMVGLEDTSSLSRLGR